MHRSRPCLALALLTAACSSPPPPLSPEERAAQERLESRARVIEKEVSELRGQEFLRPVDVYLADTDDFREYVDRRMAISYEPGEFEAEEDLAKMLALIPADLDLWETTMGLLNGQVGGYYDPDEDAFWLMEQFDQPALAGIIMAHELTHALDDQLYSMDETAASLGGNGDRELAYHAVVEGSGTALMTQWQMKKMLAGEVSMNDIADADLGMEAMKGLPEYLWKPLLGTYVRGQMFLNRTTNMMAAQMKAPKLADIDQAFRNPPQSSEQILHPKKYWDEEERDTPRAISIDASGLPKGWELLNGNTMGEIFLAMVVNPPEERDSIDPANPMSVLQIRYTNDAATGWDGDAYVLAGRGAERVFHSVSIWDDDAEAVEFAAAAKAMGPHFDAALEALSAGVRDEVAGVEMQHRGWSVVQEGNRVLMTHAVTGTPAAVSQVVESLTVSILPEY